MVKKGQLKIQQMAYIQSRFARDIHGQLKIQQMAFMLMAITLFFVLVGMFVLVISTSNLRESAAQLEAENAQLLVSRLANSPEFSCGEAYGTQKSNCIDADKVMMLKESATKYQNFWGVSNIEIRKVGFGTTECNLGNYPNCDIIKIFSGDISSEYSNFVALCWKDLFEGDVYDRCEIARLIVGYEDEY